MMASVVSWCHRSKISVCLLFQAELWARGVEESPLVVVSDVSVENSRGRVNI